jgi:hypothetical protein
VGGFSRFRIIPSAEYERPKARLAAELLASPDYGSMGSRLGTEKIAR